MRVVAGTARGRRLVAPAGRSTRPTSDRVREAVFNALASLGVVHDAAVVDLFAGSGAMGIEALSRGARSATFVESDRSAVEVIEANLVTCGFANVSRVVAADAVAFAGRQLDSAATADLVLVDPPYAFDRWDELLTTVRARWLVVESDRAIELGEGWEVQRQRSYGGTVVAIASARPAAPGGTEER